MDFELSADQRALREAAARLLADRASPERVRAVVDAGSGFDEELTKHVVEQGWLALDLPEAEGGIGLGFVEPCVLAEQVGRHVAPVPFVSNVLAIEAARIAGRGDWVERLVSGVARGAVAWGDGVVADLPVADLLVMVGEHQVMGAELTAPIEAVPVMDVTRAVARMPSVLPDVSVLGDGSAASRLLDRGATLLACELLGASERMLEVATEYAKIREQFGKPIGSFQAVKHRLADALVDVEGMRSAAYYAAWAVSVDADDAPLAASTAKAWCSDAADRVMRAALQAHGGIGFTWEHDLHLYLKRAQLSGVLFGDAVFHRRRITRLLRDRVEAGADLW